MGLEPVLVSYAVCVCEYMCDRWEDVKAPLPLMLKPALWYVPPSSGSFSFPGEGEKRTSQIIIH